MRVVADTGSQAASMIGRVLGSVILDRNVVNGPFTGWSSALADGQVEMVRTGQISGVRIDIEGQDDMEPALRVDIEIAAGVGDKRPLLEGCPVDLGWVTIEGVEIDHAGDRRAGGRVHLHHVV